MRDKSGFARFTFCCVVMTLYAVVMSATANVGICAAPWQPTQKFAVSRRCGYSVCSNAATSVAGGIAGGVVGSTGGGVESGGGWLPLGGGVVGVVGEPDPGGGVELPG